MKRVWSHSVGKFSAVKPSNRSEIDKGRSLSTVGRRSYFSHFGDFHAVVTTFGGSAKIILKLENFKLK